MRNLSSRPLLRTLTAGALALVAVAAPPQKAAAPLAAQKTVQPDPSALAAIPNLSARAELLAAGKTQGTFHLNGVVDSRRTVILRWANDRGEMPTEGVVVSRQREGETAWKELNPRKPVAFFRTDGLAKRLKDLPAERREALYSMLYSDMARDPSSGRRMALAGAPVKGMPATFSDIKVDKIPEQFRGLRAAGRLAVPDLLMLNSHADLDPSAADAYGLVFRDQPPSGRWNYKIRVNLPEGGAVEAVCPKTFDPAAPTPIPPPPGVTTRSGNGAVLLEWKAARADTVAAYNVYRAPDPKGPYRRINADPVKLVSITAEDPELTLARATARGEVIARETRKVPQGQMTPMKMAEIRTLASDSVGHAASLPALPPAQSKAIKAAVASGRLSGAGPVKALSVFTDSIRTEGNTDFVNEQTFHYKVVSVDIAGSEGAADAVLAVPGTPKDLQPPQVPGRPGLAGAAAAGLKLREAQVQRMKDPKLLELHQAVKAKSPGALAAQRSDGPLYASAAQGLQPAKTSLALRPEIASLSLGEAKKAKLSQTMATMPVKELAALAEAGLLRSLPDGTAPKADLVWTPSTDPDLKEYTVYRSASKGPMVRLGVTTAPSWQDATLEVGKAYTYAVTASDQLGNESKRSPEWVLQVCDSALRQKLALKGVQGKVATGPAPAGPSRRFLRPADRLLATTGLDRLAAVRSTVKLPPAATASLVSTFSEPKAASVRTRPALAASRTLAPAARDLATSKGLELQAVEPKDLKVSAHVTAFKALPARSFNPMLALVPRPAEIHVQITWEKPLDGFPLEYTVLEAPQDIHVVSTPRKPIKLVPANLGMLQTVGAARPAVHLGSVAPVQPVLQPAVASRTVAPAAGMIQSTPTLHVSAAKLQLPAAAVLAASRKDLLASVEVQAGPGTFALISPVPVAGESFAATFPAEAAQYGGATFYFRIQAHTKEFGRRVEGPLSEPLEVRLPDIVPPPVPEPGSVDLHETPTGGLDVNLAWTQAPAPDLAGTLVDRQPMDFKTVDGIAVATTPLGAAQRLTAAPAAGLAFRDAGVPGGFYRYTLRSADATGNISGARGSLDVLVPGEPFPDPPQGIVLSGDHLSWQAGRNAAGYSVWRSFTGTEGDFDCISPLLGPAVTAFDLPPQGKVYLRVVARSASGMYQAPSEPVRHP